MSDRVMQADQHDPFDLNRFVEAQQDTYAAALAEIRQGAKRTHWMWFIFPQIAGLGSSPMARRYALRSLDEARAYLAHPILGPRYAECVMALQALPETAAEQVFGAIDAIKLRSCLTLFAMAADEPLFSAAIKRWFGSEDASTLRIVQSGQR